MQIFSSLIVSDPWHWAIKFMKCIIHCQPDYIFVGWQILGTLVQKKLGYQIPYLPHTLKQALADTFTLKVLSKCQYESLIFD